jgi:hypothetical protein
MDTPIACSLTPGQYQSRTADLKALADRALRSREQTDHGERLTFEAGGEVERALRAAVAAEAACCAFLTMDLQRREDHLLLDISGPQEARPIIAELFS